MFAKLVTSRSLLYQIIKLDPYSWRDEIVDILVLSGENIVSELYVFRIRNAGSTNVGEVHVGCVFDSPFGIVDSVGRKAFERWDM
jgi:hypothetical protein